MGNAFLPCFSSERDWKSRCRMKGAPGGDQEDKNHSNKGDATRHILQSSVGLSRSHARSANGQANSVTLPTALLWDHRGDVWLLFLGSPEKPNGAAEPPPPSTPCSMEVTKRPTDIHTDTGLPSSLQDQPDACPCAAADRGGYPPAARLSRRSS